MQDFQSCLKDAAACLLLRRREAGRAQLLTRSTTVLPQCSGCCSSCSDARLTSRLCSRSKCLASCSASLTLKSPVRLSYPYCIPVLRTG